MRAAVLSLVVSVMVGASAVQADEVYKWVDKNGVVHYGEFPPNNKKSKTIETPSKPEPTADEPATDSETESSASKTTAPSEAPKANSRDKFLEDRQKQKDEKEKAEKAKKEKARACNEANSNVEMLQSGGKVRIVDENGNAKLLSPEEIEKRLLTEKKNVEKYCKK